MRSLLAALSLLLASCATPPVTGFRPSPPPAALAEPCADGPTYPALGEGETISLEDLLAIVLQREEAALECRLRQRALVEAWPR